MKYLSTSSPLPPLSSHLSPPLSLPSTYNYNWKLFHCSPLLTNATKAIPQTSPIVWHVYTTQYGVYYTVCCVPHSVVCTTRVVCTTECGVSHSMPYIPEYTTIVLHSNWYSSYMYMYTQFGACWLKMLLPANHPKIPKAHEFLRFRNLGARGRC